MINTSLVSLSEREMIDQYKIAIFQCKPPNFMLSQDIVNHITSKKLDDIYQKSISEILESSHKVSEKKWKDSVTISYRDSVGSLAHLKIELCHQDYIEKYYAPPASTHYWRIISDEHAALEYQKIESNPCIIS